MAIKLAIGVNQLGITNNKSQGVKNWRRKLMKAFLKNFKNFLNEILASFP
jgi:hypothetical protein